ncbi:membrane protein [Secundilactobacillus pentosiphilus]|uniref:Membrane protein n=1 Tax=Secundilactobacillus pentosiphilus TaxID=1714682 RepID=A0A1Z5IS99_9LACO|nr:AI-2E family transporter [Secundilactobacillus pentosiphilus]GAX04546.1 membrane protein [Secundilactobacillus pentosiphilus]
MTISKKSFIWSSVVVALFLACLVYPGQIFGAIGKLLSVLNPLILGGVMAYAVNLLSRQLEKWLWPHADQKWAQGLRRPLAILLALLIIVLVIAGVMRLVIPQFIDAINSFFKTLPSTVNDVTHWLNQVDHNHTISQRFTDATSSFNWQSIESKATKYLTAGASGIFSSTVSIFTNIFSGLLNFVLAFVFSIYLISGKEKIGGWLNRLMDDFLPNKFVVKTRYVLRVTDKMFSSFIAGQVLEGFILGTLCTLGMMVFQFPDALSIGALVGVSALIPMIGAWIGGVVGFVLIAVSSPIKAILFVVFIVILQQIEGNLIYPRVVGGTIGLPGILVLAAITVGSGLSGIVGMMLAVPVTATLYRLMRNATFKKEGILKE